VNELENDPRISGRYQIWLYIYNTGNPIALSGSRLRHALLDTLGELDPEGVDAALQRTVVIGHSQGGLLTKLTAIDSGTRFWDGISNVPIDELDLKPETRELIENALFVKPVPSVSRVVFIATPHRGSYLTAITLAGLNPSNWVRGLIKLPGNVTGAVSDLMLDDHEGRLKRSIDRTPTSIDNMTPGNPFLQALAETPLVEGVTAHSIIAVKGDGPPEEGSDGVVKYSSAHIEGVESELVVRSAHSCQSQPETIEEVRRILLEHAQAP
jgi:pimeloyl-ACP methyl ester carboxylesterase